MTLYQRPQSNEKHDVHLDDFGADLEGAGAELLASAVRVLPVDHADVGAASGRNHLHTHRNKINSD